MTKTVETTAKTIEEAISMALAELKEEKESVDIEIIEEGNKGLFGLIGSKQARVKVSLKTKDGNNRIEKFLQDLFNKMDMKVEIEIKEETENIQVNLKGDNMGILIGRRGETLDALQYLTSIVANKGKDDYKKVIMDTENYRRKREEALINLANNVAERVIRLRKSVTLEPMNPYERRIIHSALQQNNKIETYSVGEEPNRKVVIAIK
jgi:spoIIIJ-associated protein